MQPCLHNPRIVGKCPFASPFINLLQRSHIIDGPDIHCDTVFFTVLHSLLVQPFESGMITLKTMLMAIISGVAKAQRLHQCPDRNLMCQF